MGHSFVNSFDFRTFARVLSLASALVTVSLTVSAQHEGHGAHSHMPQPTPTPPAAKATPTPGPAPMDDSMGGMDHSSHAENMAGMNHASTGDDAGGLLVMSGEGMGVRVGASGTNVMPMGQMGSGTAYSKPRSLDALYGQSPASYKLSVRIRPGKMSH
jgi:hypothetical protein